ncbi:MAG TPA: murein biosynthesis integral membrane protein MurJ [Pantanalinema sp.]
MASKLARASGVMAALLLVSKGAGFLRESVVAGAYGAGMVKDANTVAYILPALFLIMLGGLNGPFHLATMGAVTRLETRGEREEIPGVLLTILLGTAALTGLFAAVVFALAPWVIAVTGPSLSSEAHALAVTQLRIMAPLIVIGGLVGALCGVSNVRGKFANASLSPMVSSLAVIALVFATSSPLAIAWGTLAGAVGQLLLQAWPVVRDWREIAEGAPLRPAPLTHPAFVDMLRMLLPAALSSSVGSINVAIGTAFCSKVGSGAISVFNYSNLLIQLPLGIMLTALLVPMFPKLTEAAASGDRASLHGWLNKGLQTIVLTTLPMTGLLVVLGESAVRLAFERGAFSARDTAATATVLSIVALSIVAYATRDLFTRVFYAQNKSRVPLMVTLVSIGTNFLLNSYFVRFGIKGLALSTTLVTVLNMLILGGLLRKDLGRLGLSPSVPTALKALASAIVATSVTAIARVVLPGEGQLGALLQLALLGVLGLASYVGLLVALRVPFVAALRGRRRQAVAGE